MGMFLFIDILLLPLGLYCLFKRDQLNAGTKTFIMLWLVLSPLPAALSRDQVQAVRALNMSIPILIVLALGLNQVANIANFRIAKAIRFLTIMLAITGYFASVVYFLDSYFVHLPKHNAKYWYYGYREMVEKVLVIKDDYQRVLVQQSYDQPYIYFLFYGSQLDPMNFDPGKYQQESRLVVLGPDVGLIERLDDIYFREMSWPPPLENVPTLFVGNEIAIPDHYLTSGFTLIAEIRYPDNYTTSFRIISKD